MTIIKSIIVLAILLIPSSLQPSQSSCYVEKWPVVIMAIGDRQYIRDEPGGEVRMEDGKGGDHARDRLNE